MFPNCIWLVQRDCPCAVRSLPSSQRRETRHGRLAVADAAKLGQAIGVGEIDPVELTEVFLTAIKNHDLKDRIYARNAGPCPHDPKAASDRAKPVAAWSFGGVPISWKDLFDTPVSRPKQAPLMEGRTNEDAEVLKTQQLLGWFVLAKHICPRSLSGLGLNPITGSPPCE